MIGVMFMGSTLVTPLYVLYRQAFGFSEITLTLVYAAYVVGNLAAVLFFGRLSDEFGRRRTVLPAMGLAAISSLAFLFAQGTAWLFAGRIIIGFAVGVSAAAGAAWLAELDADKPHATLMATGGNFAGIALGPVLAGLLAEYGPWPLELPQIAYLACVATVALLIARTPETVRNRVVPTFGALKLRVGVPAGMRKQFVAPAASAFATFSFVGFFAALLPSILADSLGERSHLIAGGIVSAMFAISTATVIVGRGLSSRTAMLAGVSLLLPSLALLVLAQMLASMPLLVIGTALGGVAAALGYRGGLEVVNQIAPPDRRAELVSSYFLACFTGNSLPVIGVGALTMAASSLFADTVFALVTALVALTALMVGRRYLPES
jgi:MFS family permease